MIVRYARAVALTNCLIAVLFIALLSAQSILIDSVHLDDTILLAHLGWRGLNGFFPNTDYPHFYGGIVAQFITWSFKAFGADFKSINYAFLMMYLAGISSLFILSLKRLSTIGLSTLIVFSAALILSLAPIETGFIRGPIAAHSFVYNHVGIVIMMGLTAFAAKGVQPRSFELASAVFAGFSAYALVLLKTTFGIFAPFLLLALLFQRRWLTTAFLILGTILGMILMDPGMTRALESLDTLLSTAAAESRSGVRAILFSSIHNVAAQLVALLLILVLLLELWARNRSRAIDLSWTAILCGTGYIGALVSMSGTGSYMLLPILVVVSSLLADAYSESQSSPLERKHAPSEGRAPTTGTTFVLAVPVILCYSYVIPALFSSAVTFLTAQRYQDASLIPTGPAASYVVIGDAIETIADMQAAVRLTSAAIDKAQGTVGSRFNDSEEYVMYADGVRLLTRIPRIEDYGVVSNGRMFDFTPALASRPVLSYPVWPTGNLDYFQSDAPLGADIDLVMISRDVPALGLVGPSLIERMADDFVVCRQTAIWTLYARRQLSDLENLSCENS